MGILGNGLGGNACADVSDLGLRKMNCIYEGQGAVRLRVARPIFGVLKGSEGNFCGNLGMCVPSGE